MVVESQRDGRRSHRTVHGSVAGFQILSAQTGGTIVRCSAMNVAVGEVHLPRINPNRYPVAPDCLSVPL